MEDLAGKVAALKEEIEKAEASSKEAVEAFRMRFISRKSVVTDLFAELKNVPAEGRKAAGQLLNELKGTATNRFKALAQALEQQSTAGAGQANIDLTLPTRPDALGAQHPLNLVKARVIKIFERIGFSVAEGPEIEDDWHNFTALNFPPNHPAREMQDTFFIEKDPDIALRTHTSSVQVRVMESQDPPIRVLSPGRVYRNEAISARAHCFFHQVEGLYIDKNVSFKDLKQTIYHFAKEMFGSDTKIRFRPSYFPFTEPSAEIDISCPLCKGKGCKVCKHTTWVEIAGSGMVDPAVLQNSNIDPQKYSGFAFGMGIERMAMLLYQVDDLRLFSENDVRFLRQFQGI